MNGLNHLDMISQNLNANKQPQTIALKDLSRTANTQQDQSQNQFLQPTQAAPHYDSSRSNQAPNQAPIYNSFGNYNNVQVNSRNVNERPLTQNETMNNGKYRSRSQNPVRSSARRVYGSRQRGNSRNPLSSKITNRELSYNQNQNGQTLPSRISSNANNLFNNQAAKTSPLHQRVPNQYTNNIEVQGSDDHYEMEIYTSNIQNSGVAEIQYRSKSSFSKNSVDMSQGSSGRRLRGSGFLHIPKVKQPNYQQADRRKRKRKPKKNKSPKRYLQNGDAEQPQNDFQDPNEYYNDNLNTFANEEMDYEQDGQGDFNARKKNGFGQNQDQDYPNRENTTQNTKKHFNQDWTIISEESGGMVEGFNRGEVDLKERHLREYEKTRSELKTRKNQLFTRKYELSERDRIDDLFSEHTNIASFAGGGSRNRRTNPPVSRLQQIDVFAQSFPKSKTEQKTQRSPRGRGRQHHALASKKQNDLLSNNKIDPFSYGVDLANLVNDQHQTGESNTLEQSSESDAFKYSRHKKLYSKKGQPALKRDSAVFDRQIEQKIRRLSRTRVQNEIRMAQTNTSEDKLKQDIVTLNRTLEILDQDYKTIKQDTNNPLVIEEEVKNRKRELDQTNYDIQKFRMQRIKAGEEIKKILDVDTEMKNLLNLMNAEERRERDRLVNDTLKNDQTYLRLMTGNEEFKMRVQHNVDFDWQKDEMLKEELQKIQFELASERREGEEEELMRLMNRMYGQFNARHR